MATTTIQGVTEKRGRVAAGLGRAGGGVKESPKSLAGRICRVGGVGKSTAIFRSEERKGKVACTFAENARATLASDSTKRKFKFGQFHSLF